MDEVRSGTEQNMKEDFRDGDKNVYMRDRRIAIGDGRDNHSSPSAPIGSSLTFFLPPNPRPFRLVQLSRGMVLAS